MQSKIDEIKKLAEEKISKIKNSQDLQELKVQFLGKKSELSNLLKGLGALTAEERPKVGALVNEARKEIEEKLSIAEEQIKSKMLEEKIEKETTIKNWQENFKNFISSTNFINYYNCDLPMPADSNI